MLDDDEAALVARSSLWVLLRGGSLQGDGSLRRRAQDGGNELLVGRNSERPWRCSLSDGDLPTDQTFAAETVPTMDGYRYGNREMRAVDLD